MGYDSSRFLGEVDEELHCSICSMVLQDPVQTPCDHSFCNECIKPWIKVNAICPVDRKPLTITNLKPASRLMCNILAKLKIKCDFLKQGCVSIITLEQLQNHLTTCEYNPNSEIICEKGCNLRMNRHEYVANNCFMHLSNRVACQEVEIIRLIHGMTNQKEDYDRVVNRQTDDIVKLKDENVKLKDEVRSLQEQIGRLIFTRKQIEIKKRPLKWQDVTGINISTDELNILEGSSGGGFAQLSYPLDSSNYSFKVEILKKKSDAYIYIELWSPQVDPNDAICYRSDGKLNGGIFKNRYVPALTVGDIIECGIDYTYNFNIDGTYNVELYFHKNGEFILKDLVTMPRDGFYPRVWLQGSHKIKFSIN